MADVAVIDYGMGNLRSVSKAIEHVAPGMSVVVTGDPAEVSRAGRVVFPGQGAMPDCMRKLKASGLLESLLRAAETKPLLGVCIGEQMLFERSEEGDTPGLGIFPGQVKRFAANLHDAGGERLKVPHMGWNRVFQQRAHPLFAGIEDGERVRVESAHGVIEAVAWIHKGIRPTAVFIPIGWGERQPFNPWPSVNFLTDKSQRDPVSDQTNLKSLLCRVSRCKGRRG